MNLRLEAALRLTIRDLNKAVASCEESGYKVSLNDGNGRPFYVTPTDLEVATPSELARRHRPVSGGWLAVPVQLDKEEKHAS